MVNIHTAVSEPPTRHHWEEFRLQIYGMSQQGRQYFLLNVAWSYWLLHNFWHLIPFSIKWRMQD